MLAEPRAGRKTIWSVSDLWRRITERIKTEIDKGLLVTNSSILLLFSHLAAPNQRLDFHLVVKNTIGDSVSSLLGVLHQRLQLHGASLLQFSRQKLTAEVAYSDSSQLRSAVGKEAEILICNVNFRISAKVTMFFGGVPTAEKAYLLIFRSLLVSTCSIELVK